MGIFREYWNKCFWRPKCFGKGTSSVYGIADIKREGRSSDYAVLEIKWEMPFSPSVFGRVTEVRHMFTRHVSVDTSKTIIWHLTILYGMFTLTEAETETEIETETETETNKLGLKPIGISYCICLVQYEHLHTIPSKTLFIGPVLLSGCVNVNTPLMSKWKEISYSYIPKIWQLKRSIKKNACAQYYLYKI